MRRRRVVIRDFRDEGVLVGPGPPVTPDAIGSVQVSLTERHSTMTSYFSDIIDLVLPPLCPQIPPLLLRWPPGDQEHVWRVGEHILHYFPPRSEGRPGVFTSLQGSESG